MILCNPRISSFRVQRGPPATTAASLSLWSSDDLPRLPSAAAIVAIQLLGRGRGSRRIISSPFSLPSFDKVHHVWVVEIFQVLQPRCRILVSLWDNGASVEGRLSGSTDTSVEQPRSLAWLQAALRARRVCHREETNKWSDFCSSPNF